jgi:hypothetical protein
MVGFARLAGALLASATLVGAQVAETAQSDSCTRVAKSIRERDCCSANARNCGALWASYERRGCESDPCLIGCGANLCDVRLEYCCNESCSQCADLGGEQVCTAEICVP